ncbi:centromere protein P isoform X2 [Halichoeres trimaculatus]
MEEMSRDYTKELEMLEAEVKSLRAEMNALLHKQQDENQEEYQEELALQYSGKVQDAMSFLCGQTQGEELKKLALRIKEEVEEMKEDLKLQTQINRICLTSCTIKTLLRGDNKLVQKLCVSGQCSELAFQVEFLLSEVKEDQKSTRAITELNVVMDVNDLQEFSSFLSGVEERNDLQLFFRTLRSFSARCDDRSRTFEHFQNKYPAVVSFPGGSSSEVMALNHPELPGLVLFVHWSVNVSTEGEVTPKIELLTKIPEEALQLFPSNTLEGAPEAFQSLLRILGPEAALESVIRSICLSEEP